MKTEIMILTRLITGKSDSTSVNRKPYSFIRITVILLLVLVSQHMSAQDVKINNNMVIEADGTLRLDNAATVWNDLMVFPDATTKGGSNPPEWGSVFKKNAGGTSQGVYLWMFSPTVEEELYITVQIPHDYKVGSDLHPHVHWTTATGTPSGSDVVWGLEYTIAAVGGTFPNTGILTSNTLVTECGTPSGTGQHLISPFSSVSGAGLGISSVLICRLFRVAGDAADTFPDAVGLLGFDIHYEQDTQGSREQWTK